MIQAAVEKSTPIAVVGGVIRPGSGRLRWPARSFLRRLYRNLAWVGAVTPGDAERWVSLGAPEQVVEVTGDPRHDQVLEEVTDLTLAGKLANWSSSGPTLVAGSVEREDEAILLRAFAQVLRAVPNAHLLIVPHDPSSEITWRIVEEGGKNGIRVGELTENRNQFLESCVVFPRRGALSSVYSIGQLAYVGGGFRRDGLHAVIEPAAYGLPVIIGPEFGSSADAREMVGKNGAVALPLEGSHQELASTWIRWLRDDQERQSRGLWARKVLSQGAAGRSARRLLSLLARG
jgi:3-deoxy-D-manno-octulosonic-acid transferase